MFEEMIVKYCSPTLAGLKTANMFTCKKSDNIEKCLEKWNKILNPKGIYISILKDNPSNYLIYTYRKDMLEKDFLESARRDFLKKHGYNCFNLDKCLHLLKQKLQHKEFPHEIAAFLGYPIGDIIGFIDNKGTNYEASGYWKIYSSKESTLNLFSKFDKCTKVYCKMLHNGFNLAKLTVKTS